MEIRFKKKKQTNGNHLKAIINAQQEMICRFLPDTTLTFVNKAYCRSFNLSEDQLIGRKWLDFTPEKERPVLLKYMEKAKVTGETVHYTHEVITQDGKVYWQRWSDIPIFDDFGKLREFQSVGLDITAQKEAELALKWERNRLNSILKTIDHVVWTAEVNPFRIVFISEPIFDLTGYEPEFFLEDPGAYEKIIPIDELGRIRGKFREIFNQGFVSLEVKIKTRQGKEKFILFKAWLCKGGDDFPSKIEAVLSDISAQKDFEKKLISLNEGKDRIMATMAHDLRNPISGILSLCNILERKKDNSEDLFYIDLIKRSSQAALGIMEELLEIFEMESESYSLALHKMPLNNIIPELLEHFESDATEKRIKLSHSLPKKTLFADINIRKFSRVLENLISNALKFTSEGGAVSVSLEEKGDNVLITVADTGIGIPVESQSFLFEKFTRAKRYGLKGEKTHGLGMYITRHIVDLHQGSIYFESQEHEGTRFFVELKKSD